MRNVWSSLKIDLQSKRSLGVDWRQRMPALDEPQRAGRGRYFFFPSLNVGVKRLDRGSLDFLHAHFVSDRPSRNRWFWKGMFAIARLWPKATPAILTGDLEGDVVSLGNSLLEFDLQRKICRKHYRGVKAPYLLRSAEVLAGVSEDIDVKTTAGGICLTTPIWEGSPLPESSTPDQRWQAYTRAFQQLAEMQSQHACCWPLGEYVQELMAGAPPEFQQHPLAVVLLEELRDVRRTIVVSVTHGDFKDDNLLCGADGVRIIDWELADLRSAGHDLFNLLIHPALYGHRTAADIQQRLGADLWQNLHTLSNHLEGGDGSADELPVLIKLALLEKGVLLLKSGRWPGLEQQCLHDWATAVSRLNEGFLLGLGV